MELAEPPKPVYLAFAQGLSGVKRQWREIYQPRPSSAEIKNENLHSPVRLMTFTGTNLRFARIKTNEIKWYDF
jgi:hypothetical protein